MIRIRHLFFTTAKFKDLFGSISFNQACINIGNMRVNQNQTRFSSIAVGANASLRSAIFDARSIFLEKIYFAFKFLIFLSIIAFLTVPLKLFAAAETWQKTAFITNSFYEIALGSEYGNSALKVRKWDKPIRIYVEHQVKDSELHDELLNAHISDLKKITRLDIKRVKNKRKANIKYYFTSQKKLPALVMSISGKGSTKHLRTSVCMATMRASHSGSIQSAVVYIPVDQARMHAKLVSCIVEELTQVLGLPRDSDEVFPSIFNDHSYNEVLTGLDVVLLKILYNSQIKSGMSRPTLQPLLKSIIKRMRYKGEISQSTKTARTLSLCAYIDC